MKDINLQGNRINKTFLDQADSIRDILRILLKKCELKTNDVEYVEYDEYMQQARLFLATFKMEFENVKGDSKNLTLLYGR